MIIKRLDRHGLENYDKFSENSNKKFLRYDSNGKTLEELGISYNCGDKITIIIGDKSEYVTVNSYTSDVYYCGFNK